MHITIQDPKKNPHDLVVGIDLGTTNSLLTYFDGHAFKFMEWHEGKVLLPSVATYNRQGVHHVGYQALAHPLESGILASTKRLLDDPNQHIWAKITPLKVATDILAYMKRYTEETLGRAITACIITVPAYFDEVQRLATKTAANLAGLNVLRLIHEPTAAALAYDLDMSSSRKRGSISYHNTESLHSYSKHPNLNALNGSSVASYALAEDDRGGVFAVYDLGGGTFDVSILSITDQFFHVLATHGDTMLGGDDIDTAILQYWYTQNRPDLTELKKQVISIKEDLSVQDGDLLTRTELSNIVAPLLVKTFDHFDQALKDADITRLDGIVLVGGATKTYGLKQALQKRYPFPIYDKQDPEIIVALGAGMHACSLIFGGQHVLLDVTPLSLGVEMAGGLVEKIIHRNTPLPVRQEQIFTTYEAGQQGITFNIVQGERERAQDCRSLARFTISNLPPMPPGKARAHVTFQIDVDGLITVSAIEHLTGQTLSIQIESALSKEECDALIADAMVHAKEDLGFIT